MIKRFHGIDRHKMSSTVSILNQEGVEEKLVTIKGNLKNYIKNLGPCDAVAIETGIGCFYWANRIESRGAKCFIIDPYRFRIIKDSWKKTDKNDCRNIAKALWVYIITGEFGLPEVYKPKRDVIELRKLFAQYRNMNKYINMLKNNIQAILLDDGIVLTLKDKKHLLSEKEDEEFLDCLDITDASKICIKASLDILWKATSQKEVLTREIIRAGEPFKDKVKILISIKGITPLSALAFLADVGDIKRFKSVRKMNSYLGLVPKVKESANKGKSCHINKASRNLTRTILTQSLIQAMDASTYLRSSYEDTKIRRGAGRARIGLIRKLCGIMRRMLLNGELFRNVKKPLYEKKMKQYDKLLKEFEEERKTA
jgi:transposase